MSAIDEALTAGVPLGTVLRDLIDILAGGFAGCVQPEEIDAEVSEWAKALARLIWEHQANFAALSNLQ
jgi:hypothetical protein